MRKKNDFGKEHRLDATISLPNLEFVATGKAILHNYKEQMYSAFLQ